MQSTQTTLKASDIRCGGCAASARAALSNVPGVDDVSVDLPSQVVTVTHESGVSRRVLAEALTGAGFPAE